MKALILCMDSADLSPEPAELKLCAYLARAGIEVHAIKQTSAIDQVVEDLPNLKVTLEPDLNTEAKADEVAAKLGSDFDVTFATSASGAPLLARLKAATGRPAACQLLDVPVWRFLADGPSGDHTAKWRGWFEGLSKLDLIVGNAKKTVQDLVFANERIYGKAFTFPPSRVVYYGVDTDTADRCQPMLMRPEIERAAGGKRVALGVSRLVHYKGFDLALQAISMLPDEGRPYYVIAGEGADERRLIETAALYGINFTMVQAVRDMEKFGLIKRSDFGLSLNINPYVSSLFPLEAAYCGRPSIVGDLPINVERFGGAGVTYANPLNSVSVSETIERMNRMPESFPVHDRDRRWIRENRSIRSQARDLATVLQRLAKK